MRMHTLWVAVTGPFQQSKSLIQQLHDPRALKRRLRNEQEHHTRQPPQSRLGAQGAAERWNTRLGGPEFDPQHC